MLFHSTSELLASFLRRTVQLTTSRYEIANGGASWEDAERQIQAGKSSTVAVKSHKEAQKRKAGEALEDAQKEAATLEGKKSKRGKKSRS